MSTDALERAMRNAAAAVELGAAPALPRIDSRGLRAINRLLASQPPFECVIGQRALRWRWCYAPPVALDAAGADERYGFRLGPHRGRFALDAAAHAIVLGDADAIRLPQALRGVLLADALMPWVRPLEQAARKRFEWTPQPATTPARVDACAIDFELAQDAAAWPLRGFGYVACDEPALLDALCAAFARAPTQARAIDWLHWPLAFELGSTPLRLHELRGVRRGDIVAIEQWRSAGSAIETALVLGRSHRASLAASIDGDRAVLSPWKDFTMETFDTTAAADARNAVLPIERLDGMEVMLRFEVGDLAVSLRELRSLEPGHVFDLGQPLNRSTVRILAHGNLLGTGHLVALGDRLGVRVAEFAPNADE